MGRRLAATGLLAAATVALCTIGEPLLQALYATLLGAVLAQRRERGVNDVMREALALEQDDLRKHRTQVRADSSTRLARIRVGVPPRG